MKYEIITDKTWDQIKKDNIDKIYKQDIKIPSIRETYIPNSNNILTNDGVLYIKAESSLFKFNIFDAEDTGTPLSFDNVAYNPNMANTTSPNYEATHRIVLFKDAQNRYYAEPIYIGKRNDNEYLFILDSDFIPGTHISSDGYFINNTEIIDKQFRFYFNYNHLLYINIPNIDFKLQKNKLNLKYFYNISGGTSSKTISLKKNETYVIIPENTDIQDLEDYTQIELYGTADSPDQIIMEVF